ncbi:MAG: threonylcarbamoyl-AMP synthase [Caldilineaceae bacterium]|nr:threonylcarbamoyl-AMP synthase [Caldilineaceae bacterium]
MVKVDKENPDPALLQTAADLLACGELVAFPTETVYGLGANALDSDAVSKIFVAKGRPLSDPLIVHIYSISQMDEIAVNMPPVAWDLAHAFWPGPLTIVLPKHRRIPANVSAGLETVAVRMPNHRVPHALFRLADLPVVAPSANLFSRPSPTTAQHVLDDLGGRIPMILDGGATEIGVESTVLDLTGDRPLILRPGGLPIEVLRPLIPTVSYTPRYAALDGTSAPSPGMLLKHYSPSVQVLLFHGAVDHVLPRIERTTRKLLEEGKAVGLMLSQEDEARFDPLGATVASLGSEDNLGQIAQNLFARMRELERSGVDVILTRTFDSHGLGLAIADRLIRATEGKVIEVR